MQTSLALTLAGAVIGYARPRARRKKLTGAVLGGLLGAFLAPKVIQAAQLPATIGRQG